MVTVKKSQPLPVVSVDPEAERWSWSRNSAGHDWELSTAAGVVTFPRGLFGATVSVTIGRFDDVRGKPACTALQVDDLGEGGDTLAQWLRSSQPSEWEWAAIGMLTEGSGPLRAVEGERTWRRAAWSDDTEPPSEGARVFLTRGTLPMFSAVLAGLGQARTGRRPRTDHEHVARTYLDVPEGPNFYGRLADKLGVSGAAARKQVERAGNAGWLSDAPAAPGARRTAGPKLLEKLQQDER